MILYTGLQITKLKHYAEELGKFHLSHPIHTTSDEALLNKHLLAWHEDFLQLHANIHADFDVVWVESPLSSNLILALYLVSCRQV